MKYYDSTMMMLAKREEIQRNMVITDIPGFPK